MRKIFRKIHLWLSVPFGIFISLICFAGAMLVFEKEITEMCLPELYYVDKVGEKPLPMDSLMRTVAATLPDSVEATGITVSPETDRTWQVSLSKPRRASVYVDPYTGEIKGRNERLAFFDTMFHLHRWLLGDAQSKDGGMSIGKLLVGISTLVLVIILITGVVIWWPHTKRGLKRKLKICVTKGWHRFWYDLHVSAGIYATIFLLALALTGLTWSFSWYRTGFYGIFGIEASAGGSHGGGAHGGGSHGDSDRHGGERGGRPGNKGRGGRPHDGENRTEHRRHDNSEATAGKQENGKKTAEAGRAERHNKVEAGNNDVKTDEEKPREGRRQQREETAAADSTAAGEDSREHRRHDGEGDYSGRRGRGGEGRRGHRHQQDSTGSYSGRRHYHEETAEADTTTNIRHAEERKATADVNTQTERPQHDGARSGRGNRGGRPSADKTTNGKDLTARTGRQGKGEARPDSTAITEQADSTYTGTAEASPFAQWQKVYDELAEANPGFRQITLQDGSAGQATPT